MPCASIEKRKVRRRERDAANRIHLNEYFRIYRLAHVEEFRQRDNNRSRPNKWQQAKAGYYGKRREEILSARCSRRKAHLLTPHARILHNTRSRIWQALKGIRKSARTIELIGCTIEQLWLHLEGKFKAGMTRANYGPVWHVDHVTPCAKFDLTHEDNQRACFHFTNLQPLFVRENLSKGARIVCP